MSAAAQNLSRVRCVTGVTFQILTELNALKRAYSLARHETRRESQRVFLFVRSSSFLNDFPLFGNSCSVLTRFVSWSLTVLPPVNPRGAVNGRVGGYPETSVHLLLPSDHHVTRTQHGTNCVLRF